MYGHCAKAPISFTKPPRSNPRLNNLLLLSPGEKGKKAALKKGEKIVSILATSDHDP